MYKAGMCIDPFSALITDKHFNQSSQYCYKSNQQLYN